MASRFWKYFHDKLNWLPIHKPGPLAAIAKGLAHEMDDSREDILWLREQWHPARCEKESVLGYGLSRGLQRHPKETDSQWRNRVVHAYAWHMLGGKVEGLPQILRFYGFDAPQIINMRTLIPSKWAEFQLGLNTPATQEQQVALLADLDMLIWLINEYKPARSLMFRIYTDTWNIQPLVWSVGSWSECYWSDFSGVPYPDPDVFQKGDVIVSFGMAHRVQSERIDLFRHPLLWFGEHRAYSFPLFTRPEWSKSRWGQKYETRKPFAVNALTPVHGCELVARSTTWPEEIWPRRPWGVDARWDRRLPDWSMFVSGTRKSQAVWSDGFQRDKTLWPDSPWPQKSWADGPSREYSREKISTWSGLNSNWSTPVVLVKQAAPVWSAGKWSEDDLKPRYIIISEQFLERHQALVFQLNPSFDGQRCCAREDSLFMAIGGYPILTWEQADFKSRIDERHQVWASDFWSEGENEDFRGWPDAPWGRESATLEPVINAILYFHGLQEWHGRIQKPEGKAQAAMRQDLAQKGPQIAPVAPKAGIEAIAPAHVCNATQAATWADRSLWPDEPWDAPFYFYREQKPVRSVQKQAAAFKGETTEKAGQASFAASFLGLVENEKAKPAASGKSSLAAFCGDEAILPTWDGSGPWPDRAWDKILGYGRKQAPIGFIIHSETQEEAA